MQCLHLLCFVAGACEETPVDDSFDRWSSLEFTFRLSVLLKISHLLNIFVIM